MRILVIAPTPFFADRGCHVRIFEEVRALQAQGHCTTICTYHIGRDIDGFDIRRSLNVPWYSKLTAGPSLHKFYVDLFLLWTVLRACRSLKPDIIHAHLHEGILIGKTASLVFRIPLVADLQGSLTGELADHKFFKKGSLAHRLFGALEHWLVRMPDATLTSSTKMLQWFEENGHRHAKKLRVIIDGVDTKRFQLGFAVKALHGQLGLPAEHKIVGFLGVLTEYQGVSVLLEAIPYVLKRLPQTHFLIMGYPNVDHYQDKARALGISDYTTFTGRVDYEEAPHHLALCALYVSPKLLSSEGNGKLLNYMAMGRPIVASDTPINREILGNLGVYATVGDSCSLAEAMIKVLSDNDLAMALGQQLRTRAEVEFSWHVIGKRIDVAYHELVHSEVGNNVTSEPA
jgi:glycosyltransferase involved in cell wall biosynthesis